jgi:hypothetical protein
MLVYSLFVHYLCLYSKVTNVVDKLIVYSIKT